MAETESEDSRNVQTVKYDYYLKMLRAGGINGVVNNVVFENGRILITTDMDVFLLIVSEKMYKLLMEEVTIAVDKT